jgi:hypothetical protein
MKITFKQVGSLPKEITSESTVDDNVITLSAVLTPKKQHNILFEGNMRGVAEVTCDLCATPFALDIDENIVLNLTDRTFSHEEDALPEIDTIECPSGIINIDEIITSEVYLLTSDYHKCKQCNNTEEEFSSSTN